MQESREIQTLMRKINQNEPDNTDDWIIDNGKKYYFNKIKKKKSAC